MKRLVGTVIAISVAMFLSTVGLAIFSQTEKGQKIYDKLLKKEMEKQFVNSVDFPVFIGWNGYEFRTDVVEQKFSKLEKYWDFGFFENVYTHLPDVIGYRFRVRYPKNPKLHTRQQEHLVRNVAEEVLTRHFQECGVFLPVDQFIAVRIHGDILDIAIARNTLGFERIKRMRQQTTSN